MYIFGFGVVYLICTSSYTALQTLVQRSHHVHVFFRTAPYDFMGRTNISQFSDQGNSTIYANGPSETIVLLECAWTENKLQVYSLSEPDKIVLAFYSRDACLKQIEVVGRSFGSTLLIISFSFVVFYLLLASLVGILFLTSKFLSSQKISRGCWGKCGIFFYLAEN